jgi:glycosyltransferase involved in cell wall biosynthesis
MLVTIAIPSYQQERIIAETIKSALSQCTFGGFNIEVLLVDDGSTDNTVKIAGKYPIKVLKNNKNLGFTGNFNRVIRESSGDIIVFLCGDDIFCNNLVVKDIVDRFKDPAVGVVGRYYYQYLDGHPGAVMTIRGDIYVSSCQPSGVAFRTKALQGHKVQNKIFAEIPFLIKGVLADGWMYSMIKYDTIAARLHPGKKGNAATNPTYYDVKPRQSITENWNELLGHPRIYNYGFIQLKCRFPQALLDEIKISIRLKPTILISPAFWIFALTALIVPGWILRPLANFYRHRITRRFARIITREEYVNS